MEKSKGDFLAKEISKILNFYKLGDFHSIVSISKKLLKKYPEFSPLYNFLGISYRQLGDIKLAEKILLEGYSKDPKNPGILTNLGSIYRIKKNKKDSLRYFEESFKINPNDIALLVNYANALGDFDKVQDSISLLEKARLIDKNNQTVMINLASSYQNIGRFEDSRNLLIEIIQKFPSLTIPHKLLSDITKYKINDKHHLQMLRHAEYMDKDNQKNTDELKYPLYFGLAKSFEDQKDYKNSFKWLKKGNDIKKLLITRNAKILNEKNPIEKEIYFLNTVKEIFQNIDITKYDNENKSGKNLIFILGLPRSGTTLTHQIIASHSKTFGGGELNLLTRAVYDNIEDPIFLDIFKKYNFQKLKNLVENYNDNCRDLSNDGKIIVDKSPMNFRMLGFIRMLFPQSKVIHCSREPKDNCLSIYKNVFNESNIPWSYDISDLTTYYGEYKKIMNFWNTKMPGFIFNSSYELLVKNQEIQSKKMLNFCDLNWEKETLKYYQKNIPIQTLSIEQARNPIYKTSLKNYENFSEFLNFNEIDKIEKEYT